MSGPRIGLVGHPGDPQVQRLGRELAARGAAPGNFDLTDIPSYAAVHWEGERLLFGGQDLRQYHAVYARTAHFPMPTFIPGATREVSEQATFPVRESGSLMNSILAELACHMPLVNPLHSHRFHRRKPFLYGLLQRAGVPVPDFAVGCDLAAAARFVDRLDEEVVIKPLMGGEVFVADLEYLKDHHEEIDRRPFLLQRRIRGVSLRAYVVADRVVAAARIVHGAGIDWRADVQDIQALELPPGAQRAVRTAARAQGLVFAAADLELEGGMDGTPWVIDVNPAPMFAGFEARSGTDIAGPLAEHLIALATGQATIPQGAEEP